jgi:hypothetical protein
MLDPGQRLFHQRESVIAGQQFGGSSISQNCKRRRQPMRRLLLIAENSDRVGNHRYETSYHVR